MVPSVVSAEVAKPISVPDALPESERADLYNLRTTLLAKGAQLENEIEHQKGTCSKVNVEDVLLMTKCTQWSSDLQKKDTDHFIAVTNFNESVKRRMEALIERLQLQVNQDEQAIQHLRLEKRAEDFDEWTKLSTQAKEQFKTTTLGLVFDNVMNVSAMSVRRVAALSPPSANRLISNLQGAGVTDPYLFTAIRKVADVAGKPEMSGAVKELLDRTGQAKDLVLSAKELSAQRPEAVQAQLEMMVRVLSWGLEESPVLKLLVEDLEFTTASVYNNVTRRISRAQVERLTKLTEQELQSLRTLIELLKKHVQQLKNARKQLADLK
jgi:DNA polymerase III alpha subunit (gram-positive type)